MPSRIPVRVAERSFPSINQARIHYCGILHKYQPGQSIGQEDGQQVSELLASSGAAVPADSPSRFQVVKGNYGRRCFANVGSNRSMQMISITRSVRSCAAPAPSKTAGKLLAPEGLAPTL